MKPPEVKNFYPEEHTVDTDIDWVYVEFSQDMDKISAENAFSISENGAVFPGYFSWDARKLVFHPYRPFRKKAFYRFSVSERAEDSFGNSLLKDFSHSFRTGEFTAFPSVLCTDPSDGERSAGVTSQIRMN